jgi:hypothetical protein
MPNTLIEDCSLVFGVLRGFPARKTGFIPFEILDFRFEIEELGMTYSIRVWSKGLQLDSFCKLEVAGSGIKNKCCLPLLR